MEAVNPARARFRALLLSGTIALLAPGCSSGGDAPRACIPGASLACACPDGHTGAQVCSSDGSKLGSCVCSGGSAGTGGAGGFSGTGGLGGAAGATGGNGGGGQAGVAGATGGV